VTKATGNRKRNALNVERVVGSRWTSVEIREGHRHYVCTESKGSRKKKVSFEFEEKTENDSIRLPMIIMISSVLHVFLRISR